MEQMKKLMAEQKLKKKEQEQKKETAAITAISVNQELNKQ